MNDSVFNQSDRIFSITNLYNIVHINSYNKLTTVDLTVANALYKRSGLLREHNLSHATGHGHLQLTSRYVPNPVIGKRNNAKTTVRFVHRKHGG